MMQACRMHRAVAMGQHTDRLREINDKVEALIAEATALGADAAFLMEEREPDGQLWVSWSTPELSPDASLDMRMARAIVDDILADDADADAEGDTP